MAASKLRTLAIEAALLTAAAADALATLPWESELGAVFSILAVAGLLLRRRWPWVSFVLTLPALFFSSTLVAVLIALYTVAASRSRFWMTLIAGGVVFAGQFGLAWLGWDDPGTTTVTAIYAGMTAAAPIALGWLVRTRRDLAQSLTELNEALASAQQLAEEEAVASERTRIAREMHDIVSHQVSLIAVQSGALQVSASDAAVSEAARTIRSLAARTLQELRQMVSVLRTPPTGSTSVAPQPTEADIPALVAESNIQTVLELDLPPELPPGAGRALYRAVQEGLTNVRKHAPGATAEVRARTLDGKVELTVANSAPTQPPMTLPSSGHGIIGLRERAELLHGTVHATGTPDGGYRLVFSFPVSA